MERFPKPSIENECLVCCEDIKTHCVYQCNHTGVCATCVYVLRKRLNNFKCQICQEHSQSVIISPKKHIHSFQHYFSIPFYPLSKPLSYSDDISAYFVNEYDLRNYQERQKLLCKLCKGSKRKVEWDSEYTLKRHLQDSHNAHMCEICLEFRNVFFADHEVFTEDELHQHMLHGNRKNFKGHPKCPLCDYHFYSNIELVRHMRVDHVSCHICARQGEQRGFLSNMNELQRHYDEHHLSCKLCPLLVFDLESEQIQHIEKEHGFDEYFNRTVSGRRQTGSSADRLQRQPVRSVTPQGSHQLRSEPAQSAKSVEDDSTGSYLLPPGGNRSHTRTVSDPHSPTRYTETPSEEQPWEEVKPKRKSKIKPKETVR